MGSLIIVGSRKREFWFGPNNSLSLPEILKFPVLPTVHALNHCSANKGQHLWANFGEEKLNEAVQSAYYPEKPIPTNGCYTSSPFMDKCTLVMVCMFSHWTKALSYRLANASVRKDYTWGTPLKFYSDQRPILLVLLFYRCFYNSVWFGWFYNTFIVHTVFSLNSTIKIHLLKSIEILQIPWPKALLLVF